MSTKPLTSNSVNTSEQTTISHRFIVGPDMAMYAVTENNVVEFTGISSAERFESSISALFNEIPVKLLIEAVNNRTRERNYFRKYVELLEGDITDEEFDKEIEFNEDEYVVNSNIKPSLEDLKLALQLANHIKDVTNTEDLSSLFSFDSTYLDKLALTK